MPFFLLVQFNNNNHNHRMIDLSSLRYNHRSYSLFEDVSKDLLNHYEKYPSTKFIFNSKSVITCLMACNLILVLLRLEWLENWINQLISDLEVLNLIFMSYLTRHIYVRHNSGDLNDLGTKIWELFPKTATFRTLN